MNALPPLPTIAGAEVRHLPGFHGYAVSSLGHVFGSRRRSPTMPWPTSWRQLAPWTNDEGRRNVDLYKGEGRSHRKCVKVSRMVLLAFVGPAPSGTECCHNNGDCSDDRLVNLRWGTRESNIADNKAHGTLILPPPQIGESNPCAKLTDEKVARLRSEYAAGGISMAKIGKRYGVCAMTVCHIIRRNIWKHVA